MSNPRRILIIRHAEKPDEKGDPNLTPRGQTRAAALAIAIPTSFTRPDFIFASRDSHNSDRPVETIAPLAQALAIEPDDKRKDDDFQKVADDLLGNGKYAGKVVLVCWHHGKIPALATALGVQGAPQKWDDTVFDRVWQLDYDASGAVALSNLPQRLLFDDTAA